MKRTGLLHTSQWNKRLVQKDSSIIFPEQPPEIPASLRWLGAMYRRFLSPISVMLFEAEQLRMRREAKRNRCEGEHDIVTRNCFFD